jgi:isoleucyl-tRNA synthetase
MITGAIIAEIAALVGDPARATMVSALLDGRALTASELAFAARITPQTASAHLAKLTEAGLLELSPGDVELSQQTQAGWGLASDGPVTVALDLTLTDDLRREGLAREIVHHVQALRKTAGLEVSDRIVLGVSGAGDVADAVGAHREWIAAEVLASSVQDGPFGDAAASADVDVDGSPVGLSLRRE